MATISLVTKAKLAEGIRTLGPVVIPDGLTQLSLLVDTGGVPIPGIAIGLMVSLDLGVTWQPWGASGHQGAQTGPTCGFQIDLPSGIGRQAKAFLWLSAPATVGLKVQVA